MEMIAITHVRDANAVKGIRVGKTTLCVSVFKGEILRGK